MASIYDTYYGADAIWSYGCCQCQKHHYEGDALYQKHIGFQSKHGTKRVPARYALLSRLPVQFTRSGGLELDHTKIEG